MWAQVSQAGSSAHGNSCAPHDEACFFERYGNLELFRVDPVKVTHLKLIFLDSSFMD